MQLHALSKDCVCKRLKGGATDSPNSARTSSGEHCPNIDPNRATKVHTLLGGPERHFGGGFDPFLAILHSEFASQSISNRLGFLVLARS